MSSERKNDPASEHLTVSRFELLTLDELLPSSDPDTSRRRLQEAVLLNVPLSPVLHSGAAPPTNSTRPTGPIVHAGSMLPNDGEGARSRILELLDRHSVALADRTTLPGHLTGSAMVIDPSGERVLLMLHSKLGRWLQPGGHADGDHELAGVALREASEETGLNGLRVLVPAIDIDIHEIPARKSEPSHLHLDLRFAVVAPVGSVPVGNHESEELRWVPVDEVDSYSDEPGLHRLVERALSGYRAFEGQT